MSGERNVEDDLREEFELVDKNHDGMITRDELAAAMKAIGQTPTDPQIDGIMDHMDMDGSGSIEFTEFVAAMLNRTPRRESTADNAVLLFRVFDRDNDGFISLDELRSVMLDLGEHLSEADLHDMIVTADLDGDRKVNLTEFTKLMNLRWSLVGERS